MNLNFHFHVGFLEMDVPVTTGYDPLGERVPAPAAGRNHGGGLGPQQVLRRDVTACSGHRELPHLSPAPACISRQLVQVGVERVCLASSMRLCAHTTGVSLRAVCQAFDELRPEPPPGATLFLHRSL
jgi:hypothetical protein